jgi:hypothetical protein
MPSAPALYPNMCKEASIDMHRVADAAEAHELACKIRARHTGGLAQFLASVAMPSVCLSAGFMLVDPLFAPKAGITGAVLWGSAAAAEVISNDEQRSAQKSRRMPKSMHWTHKGRTGASGRPKLETTTPVWFTAQALT